MTELERLQRRVDRERRARREAEAIAERTTRALFRRQQELQVLESLASAANEADTLEDALAVAVPLIAQHGDWTAGHAWLVDRHTGAMRRAGVWHIDAELLHAPFRDATETTFEPELGLPGRVLARREPVWLEDVSHDPGFPRRGLGLSGAFGFPVWLDGDVVAVVECFSRLPRSLDDRQMAVAAQAASHLTHVAERAETRAQITRQTLYDALTGLPNRALFSDRLEHALARARRQSTLTAVFFLDVDRFKLVNDTLGHGAGDDLLCDIAERLSAGVRANDTVARFGGDEFAVLCEDLTDERHALHLGETLLTGLADAPARAGGDRAISASIGIALAGDRRATPERLMSDADAAMYRAKELGRGRCEIFDDRLRARLESRLQTERELREALTHGQLRLVYQPVVSLTTGAISSVEALVRWEHPTRGTVAPGEFLPVAEECGLIIAIGEYVLAEACRQAVRWRERLGDDAPLPINVNLAARQIGQPGFVEMVERTLRETGARPAEIALEITETAVIQNTLAASDTLTRLKALGLRVLLDDFGTGYSSLSHLQLLPIDVLKIDRSFISGLGETERSYGIVEAIVGMANALSIDVVAEGVETVEQADHVRQLGCGLAQGFLFSRPDAPDAVARLVAAHGRASDRPEPARTA
jgi:diguanylate cyclase (GGDEF)-like protein